MVDRYIYEMAAPLVWYIHDTGFQTTKNRKRTYIVAVLDATDETDPRDDADLRHQAETMTAAMNKRPNKTRPEN